MSHNPGALELCFEWGSLPIWKWNNLIKWTVILFRYDMRNKYIHYLFFSLLKKKKIKRNNHLITLQCLILQEHRSCYILKRNVLSFNLKVEWTRLKLFKIPLLNWVRVQFINEKKEIIASFSSWLRPSETEKNYHCKAKDKTVSKSGQELQYTIFLTCIIMEVQL